MTKSIGKVNLSTYASIDRSASYKVMFVGLTSRSSIFLSINKDIKLMLSPKSISAFPIVKFPIVQGIVKLPKIFKIWRESDEYIFLPSYNV